MTSLIALKIILGLYATINIKQSFNALFVDKTLQDTYDRRIQEIKNMKIRTDAMNSRTMAGLTKFMAAFSMLMRLATIIYIIYS